MKAVKFHPDAESEMLAAAAYYEEQQPDLGRRFLASVQDAVNRIMLNPHLYPTVDLDVRHISSAVIERSPNWMGRDVRGWPVPDPRKCP